jgi:hypothetical protein
MGYLCIEPRRLSKMRHKDEFQGSSWLNLTDDAIAGASHVPTMLTLSEQKLYYWMARNWANGIGDVVDLGSFIGGSTARMALGWQDAGHRPQLHAFDRFTAKNLTKQQQLYANGIPPFDGNDILPLARELLDCFSPQITFHRGQIQEQNWDGRAIEILTMDASKSPSAMDAMAAMFFGSLIAGESIVVQQDFLHWRQPWIPVQMELLADYFEPVAVCPDDTIVFLCVKSIDRSAINAARTAHLDDNALIEGLNAAMFRYNEWGLKARFQMAKKGLRTNPGVRISWAMERPSEI